ncbi:hypothetical protein NL676_016824 [Syzygium grande]|nr:hypothetical protein NL676_016824 [Syzygium grande]
MDGVELLSLSSVPWELNGDMTRSGFSFLLTMREPKRLRGLSPSCWLLQVAERAHLLWNNEHVLHLVTQNGQVILPLVFSSLEQNIQNHWNQAVLNLTRNLKKILTEMDEELVSACQRKLEEDNLMSNVAAEKRRAK